MWKSVQAGDADVSWGALAKLSTELGLSSLELGPGAAVEHKAVEAM